MHNLSIFQEAEKLRFLDSPRILLNGKTSFRFQNILLATLLVAGGIWAAQLPGYPQSANASSPSLAAQATDVSSLELVLHIVSTNPQALQQIGPDFARNYAIRNLLLLYKAPDKLRLDGHSAAFGDAVLIYNGAIRFYAVPKLHLQKKENLADQPVLRQSLLEYTGLITLETLDFMRPQFIRKEVEEGDPLLIYELHYIEHPNSSYYRIWVDPNKHLVVKRAWYTADGKLKAVFTYLAPQQVLPNVWLPTHIQVHNPEGILAADTEIQKVHADTPLSDALFETGS